MFIVRRRVVQDPYYFFDALFFALFKRQPQPCSLSVVYLSVMLGKPVRARAYPSAASANRNISGNICLALHEIHRSVVVHFVESACRLPPKVMISLEKHLCPRQIVNPLKIRDCLVESEPPRNVTADDYNVIVRYRLRPIIV